MLKGIYAPIPTPFSSDEEINWPALKKNLRWWENTPLQGLVVAGTNGEAVLLEPEEKERLFSYTREHLPAGLQVIAGTGGESARTTLRLNRSAAECGCNAVLVINPSYFKSSLSDNVLKEYFLDIAEESPLPLILYNMPRNTGLNLNASLVTELAKHPNIVGIKDSSGNIVQAGEIINNCGDHFFYFAGSASFLLPALALGAAGGTLALANIMPAECMKIKLLFEQGKLDEAKKMQLGLLDINHAVTVRWGVAGLKTALNLLGQYGGPVRSPLTALGKKDQAALKTIMIHCGLLQREEK